MTETARVVVSRCPMCGQRTVHPAWDFLKFVAGGAFLTFLMYSNASNFDVTEIKTILPYLAVAGGLKWGVNPRAARLLERWNSK